MPNEKIDRRDFVKKAGLLSLAFWASPYSSLGKEKSVEEKRKEFVEEAKNYLGTEYIWGGRLTGRNPGLDCMGLVFKPYAKVFLGDENKWKQFSVFPSELISKEQLGKPVEGLRGARFDEIDFSLFEEGDVIHLLSRGKTPDNPLPGLKEKYWTQHMGIYSSKKENLFLDAFPGRNVSENNLKKIIFNSGYEAIFATRNF